jgi:hypothetical protein
MGFFSFRQNVIIIAKEINCIWQIMNFVIKFNEILMANGRKRTETNTL